MFELTIEPRNSLFCGAVIGCPRSHILVGCVFTPAALDVLLSSLPHNPVQHECSFLQTVSYIFSGREQQYTTHSECIGLIFRLSILVGQYVHKYLEYCKIYYYLKIVEMLLFSVLNNGLSFSLYTAIETHRRL